MPSLAAKVGIAFIILAICYAKSSPVDRGPDKKYNYSGQQHDSKRSEKASLDALQDGDYYEILELGEDASVEDIRYRMWSLQESSHTHDIHIKGFLFEGFLASIILTRI